MTLNVIKEMGQTLSSTSSFAYEVPKKTDKMYECAFPFMRWEPHWYSLLPSQTGSDAARYVGPGH